MSTISRTRARQTTGRERTMKILKMVAVGALVIGLGGAPSPRVMNRLLKELVLGDTSQNRRYVYRKMRNLKNQGYLAKHGVRYTVSDKGARAIAGTAMRLARVPRPHVWDGAWHFVLFDIPLTESSARKAFNGVLLNLGFVQYQQSVLVYPFPIRETILPVCRHYKITRYVSFVTAIDIDGADTLKKHFKLA
ncbi:MAG: hypothetical protein HY460_02810 [Parcubacteria group bacterium]|nr:hypothetical protein [Parcubacteria group bacterium]